MTKKETKIEVRKILESLEHYDTVGYEQDGDQIYSSLTEFEREVYGNLINESEKHLKELIKTGKCTPTRTKDYKSGLGISKNGEYWVHTSVSAWKININI